MLMKWIFDMFAGLKRGADRELAEKGSPADAGRRFKALKEVVSICAGCRQIRDDLGVWRQMEERSVRYSGVEFSHGICPDCIQRLYPEFANRGAGKG
jgi:hypothetical protein